MPTNKEEIKKELNRLQNDENCKYDLSYFNKRNDNPYEWKTVLEGTPGTIYEDGYYLIKIVFTEFYPEDKPNIIFLNKIFHPHIDQNGNACIEPPEKNIISVLDTVENMFIDYDKNIEHGYIWENPYKYYKEDVNKFIKTAKDWVKKYAKIEDIEYIMNNIK